MSGSVSAVAEPSSRSVGPITFAWSWCGTPIPVGYESLGPAGAKPILMLPAMSTVSTRDELKALAQQLKTWLCIITDWPGFGDTARPRLDYDRDLSRCFLEALVAHLRSNLEMPAFPVIACGHGAGYAIDLEMRQPGTFTHLVLIAPTWRGPLPTMMSGRKPIQDRIRRLIHAPVIGDLIVFDEAKHMVASSPALKRRVGILINNLHVAASASRFMPLWRKANPNFGLSVKADDLARKAEKAIALPGAQNAFRRMHLNEWTEQAERWIDMAAWDACDDPVDLDQLRGRLCFGGLDLSTTTDVTALAWVFPPHHDDELWRVLSRYFVPEENLRRRAERDRVPYDLWGRPWLHRGDRGQRCRLRRHRAAHPGRQRPLPGPRDRLRPLERHPHRAAPPEGGCRHGRVPPGLPLHGGAHP
jgi:Terminase large subunit, endonuclease domain